MDAVTRPRLTAKLGLVHALPDPGVGAVTVLGVDDFESTGWIGKHHRCRVLGNHPLPHPATFRGHSQTRQAKFPRPVVKTKAGKRCVSRENQLRTSNPPTVNLSACHLVLG